MKADNLIKVLGMIVLWELWAMTQDQRVAFQYSDEWLEKEVSISPFSAGEWTCFFVPEKHILMVCLEYLQIVFRMMGKTFTDRLLRQKGKEPGNLYGTGPAGYCGRFRNGKACV